ncbi:LuxR C-terminal-related transcriptional regulator, partial [Xenophilus sp.]|uniref:LuxR C-terminal-related transcriptional regulator n=1 Tax=Xenophilus sp. TaxID=1873499 RepID=UPI0037DD9EF4
MTAAATCDVRSRVAVAHRSPCIAAGIEAVLGAQAGPAGVLVADHATALQVLEDPLRPACAARPVLVVAESHRTWQVRSAIGAGARGYLGMDCTAEELQVAVRRVAEGRRYLSVGVADQLLDDFAREAPTPRELDVLRLLARGLDNREIARRLGIAEGTVRARVRSALGRIAGPDRAPRLARALRRGALLAADAAPGAAMPGLRTAARRPAIAVRVHHRDALLMA